MTDLPSDPVSGERVENCPKCGLPFQAWGVEAVCSCHPMTERRGYWMHQWFDHRHPVTVYHGDELVAEYEGRFKLLRAWLYMATHPRRKRPTP